MFDVDDILVFVVVLMMMMRMCVCVCVCVCVCFSFFLILMRILVVETTVMDERKAKREFYKIITRKKKQKSYC